MKEIKITKANEGQRIDKYIRKYLNDAPLSFIYKIFRKKDVKVNGVRIKENYILQENDIVQIYISEAQYSELTSSYKLIEVEPNFDIAYEDENILVIYKNRGLLVIGDEKEKINTLHNQALTYLYRKNEFDPNKRENYLPSPLHRLDRNTGGLVIFAKNLKTSQVLSEALKNHEQIKKSYIALVDGIIEKDGKIELSLLKDESTNTVIVSKEGDYCLTYYKPIKTYKNCTLVEVLLATGRSHQIRAHFKAIGHPIIGDKKYGKTGINKIFKSQFNFENQFLFASKLEFFNLDDPCSYLKNKKIEKNLPKECKNLLLRL